MNISLLGQHVTSENRSTGTNTRKSSFTCTLINSFPLCLSFIFWSTVISWLTDWMIDWMTDRPIDWLRDAHVANGLHCYQKHTEALICILYVFFRVDSGPIGESRRRHGLVSGDPGCRQLHRDSQSHSAGKCSMPNDIPRDFYGGHLRGFSFIFCKATGGNVHGSLKVLKKLGWI